MATVEQTMMKVQRILTGPLNLRITMSGETISVRWEGSSTVVNLRVFDWGKDKEGEPRTLVVISSPLLGLVPPSPALYEWVARNGGSRWFGHVEVYDDSRDKSKLSLIFSHTLLGDYLDEAELSAAMFGVIGTADSLDEELQKLFGGKRWVDV
jgi:hypothetical protein